MNEHMATYRDGFPVGMTQIVSHDAPDNPSQIGIAVLRLCAGERVLSIPTRETAWLLMSGMVRCRVAETTTMLSRSSLFDESASCVHAPARASVVLEAISDLELTIYDCGNQRDFPARVFTPAQVPNEQRGRGQVGDRALRFVRTIFDRTNSPPAVELVLGEVVTFPGGWSSYPPHHHPQHELYHYRFTHPQGYGHAELGDAVVKVRQFDTIRIPAGLDHAQCAAPGYGMYYSWVIRHLIDKPYTVPEFTHEHAWTMQSDAPYWRPEN